MGTRSPRQRIPCSTAGPKNQPALGDVYYLSQAAAARRLGVHRSTLCNARHKHPLYAPALRGNAAGISVVRYHVQQVRLIEAVLAGVMELEEAALRWELFRRKLKEEAEA